ncbi:hypothetical protein GJ496_003676 [Pomphorhynchus laevis]|nr:hypothetical protein GJ496_003676 [Pomphorhynchus laevis]
MLYICSFATLLILVTQYCVVNSHGQDLACEPQFIPASFNYRIDEHIDIGKPAATLLFHGDQSSVIYSIRNQNKNRISENFRIEGNKLVMNQKLDYDEWINQNQPNPFTIELQCTVKVSMKTKYYNISLQLLDVQDNTPSITNVPLTVNISEVPCENLLN